MNELQIFNNEEFGQVRTVDINGKPYFYGVDVANALEYARPSKAVSDHCKGILTQDTIKNNGGYDEKLIPEGDIYRLVVKASEQSVNLHLKEKAERFAAWVFDEIIPTIRKHGMYATQELLDNPDLLIKVATALKEERELNKQLTHEVQVKNQLIGELKPKADYVDKILKNPGLMTITQIAKDYGMSGQAMNDLLHNKGIQYKQSGQWLLYVKYQDMGYTHSDTVEFERTGGIPGTKLNTKWTQKGRLFIYELLKKDEILPVIERVA